MMATDSRRFDRDNETTWEALRQQARASIPPTPKKVVFENGDGVMQILDPLIHVFLAAVSFFETAHRRS
jgi:hypothetical protein